MPQSNQDYDVAAQISEAIVVESKARAKKKDEATESAPAAEMTAAATGTVATSVTGALSYQTYNIF